MWLTYSLAVLAATRKEAFGAATRLQVLRHFTRASKAPLNLLILPVITGTAQY